MILIVTNRSDITSDHVVLELQHRRISYFRLNTEDLAQALTSWHFNGRESSWTILQAGQKINLSDVTAAYIRRPRLPDLSVLSSAGERNYAAGEWAALLEAIYVELDDQWLNRPTAIARAENKPGQLALAARLGFRTPASLVTNDPAALMAFASNVGAVIKPLRNGAMDDDALGPRVVFTTRLNTSICTNAGPEIRSAPFIVQNEIRKACDIRVTVVGQRVFAAEIDSQIIPETETDWRRGDASRLKYAIHHLPDMTRKLTIRLVESLGLRFGAIDLVLDQQGDYWFLEINPNGQWAWIESLTGLPIAAAIVDELLEIAGHDSQNNRSIMANA